MYVQAFVKVHDGVTTIKLQNAFFVAITCSFPSQKYSIKQIPTSKVYLENFQLLSKGLNQHLTLVQLVCKDYNIRYDLVIMSLDPLVELTIPSDVRTILDFESKLGYLVKQDK